MGPVTASYSASWLTGCTGCPTLDTNPLVDWAGHGQNRDRLSLQRAVHWSCLCVTKVVECYV